MSAATVERIQRADPPNSHSEAHLARLVVAPEDFAATSPFVFMAEDWFSPPAGFPEHPHRGIQTVTIVLEGVLEHRDHTGGHGTLRAGDIQWMTAGRGVLHSEMPGSVHGVHTLQLWLNLPREAKMAPASYRDQRLDETPAVRGEGSEVRVYAGRHDGVEHLHGSLWPLTLLELRALAGHRVAAEIPSGHRAFLYVIAGNGAVGGKRIAKDDVVWFLPAPHDGGGAEVAVDAATQLRAWLFASPVIDEPVVAHGPFVMCTMEEIREAYADYRSGRLIEGH